jgi:hypothetical protein
MVRSAHTGGAHDLSSEGSPTPEVEMSDALLADSIAGRADILPSAFVCSRTNCSGAHAIVNASISARQLGRRLVLLRGPPNVDRVFTLTGSSDAVEIADLDQFEPRVSVLLRLAAADRAP